VVLDAAKAGALGEVAHLLAREEGELALLGEHEQEGGAAEEVAHLVGEGGAVHAGREREVRVGLDASQEALVDAAHVGVGQHRGDDDAAAGASTRWNSRSSSSGLLR
jgi:hypothetical protein